MTGVFVFWNPRRCDSPGWIECGTGCWEWFGFKGRLGYGRVRIGNYPRQAHRAVYERFIGLIPSGMELDHLCRNPGCVNPSHMEPVTSAENNRRSNSPTAVNARKTHCPQGHSYDGPDTYHYGRWRQCRICKRIRERLGTGHNNGRKTHCPKGHPYSAVRVAKDGQRHRRCQTCEHARAERRRIAGEWRRA